MRITNIDTLSALLDRLITERIKWYFFTKDNDEEKAAHQEKVIIEIRDRIAEVYAEVIEPGKYNYLSEKRTFAEQSIVSTLENLIINDINIGESDRSRLSETEKEDPSVELFVKEEKRLRKNNEMRSKMKNIIDANLYNQFSKK
jgi:hypothetical protein